MRRLQQIHGKEGEELDADAIETVTPNNNVVNQPGVIQQPGVVVDTPEEEQINNEGSTSQQQQQDDSTTNSVWENGTPTTLDNGDSTSQQGQTTQQTPQQQISQEAYEASFPTQPETIFKNQPPRAATTFALFSSPTRFNPTTIHTTNTHYLNNALEGMIYLDVNGDGIRGSTLDRTINALEFDTGVGGIESTLVHCQSNEIVMGGYPLESISDVSRPNLGESVVTEALQSDRSDAGLTTFDLSSVEPGRYYIMYKSPKDYRLNANILPLERKEDSGECIPKGGEGNGYIQDVYDKGDLDWNGYCGRTIGCFEVGPKFDLKKDFANLQLNEEQDNQFEGTIDNLVALPSQNMLNIGVTSDPWPLNTNQFADGKVTFSFPNRYSSQDLEDAVPQNFESSSIKKSLELTMATLFAKSNNKIGDFDVKGVNFIGGEIFTKSRRRRMMLRGGPRDLQRDNIGGAVGVTYTFTTRGKYSPPPYEQLGALVSDSINADPVGLVKSLKDRENPDVQLPPAFDEVDDANVRHLTLKNNEQLLTAAGGMGLYGSLQVQAANKGGGLASWASIPVAILSASIASLVGVLLFRRVFTRRQKQVSNDHPLTMYMKKGSVGFAASRRRSEDSDMKKKKSGGGKSKRGFAVARRGSDDDKKKKRGYRDDEDDDEYRAAIAESSRSRQRESERVESRGRRRTEGSDNGRTISNSSRSSSAEDQSRYSAPVNGRRNNSNRHSSRRRGTID